MTHLRTAVIWVALLNLAYFGVEFGVALAIGSVSLFADSVDFLEDASINILIAVAMGWNARRRAHLGMLLAAILLAPALAGAWTAWQKLASPVAPAPLPLTLTGLGALAINLTCALILARFRDHHGSLTKAAFLSARNDAFANIAIIVADNRTRQYRAFGYLSQILSDTSRITLFGGTSIGSIGSWSMRTSSRSSAAGVHSTTGRSSICST